MAGGPVIEAGGFTAVRSVLRRSWSRHAAAPARGSPVEPLELRTLLSAYWVTLQYPTESDSNGGYMAIKYQYDKNYDGVSDYPVTAATPVAAVREAITGACCGTFNHCGTQTAFSYSFPGRDFLRDSGEAEDAYEIILSTNATTGVATGGIGLQKSWDDPYWDHNIYLPNWNDASWAVTADPRPKVWLADGMDLVASEDNRDPATFTIQREGGDTSQSIDVYFLFGGSAATSALSDGSYTDGIAEDGKDYTVTGASPDPDHPGYWKATLGAGQDSVDVTCKPLNDADAEDTESIVMSLVGDLGGQSNGAAGYTLADTAPLAKPAGTQPATRPTTQQANLKSLKISAADADTPLSDDAQNGLTKLRSPDPDVRAQGDDLLSAAARAAPTLHLRRVLVDAASPNNTDYGQGAKDIINRILNDDFTALDISAAGNTLTVNGLAPDANTRYRFYVTVTSGDAGFANHDANRPANEQLVIGNYGGAVPSITIIPKKKGILKLTVWVTKQVGEGEAETIGTMSSIAFNVVETQ